MGRNDGDSVQMECTDRRGLYNPKKCPTVLSHKQNKDMYSARSQSEKSTPHSARAYLCCERIERDDQYRSYNVGGHGNDLLVLIAREVGSVVVQLCVLLVIVLCLERRWVNHIPSVEVCRGHRRYSSSQMKHVCVVGSSCTTLCVCSTSTNSPPSIEPR